MFKVGDVVFLKSGGTPMTVVDVDGLVRCVWNSMGGYGELTGPSEALRMRDEGS